MSLQGWVRDGWASRHKSTRDGGSAEKCKAQVPIQALRSSARFGSGSAMAGVDLATLKELMGHSNISITMRYVHPTPEHKQEALRKLERSTSNKCSRCTKSGRSPHSSRMPQKGS